MKTQNSKLKIQNLTSSSAHSTGSGHATSMAELMKKVSSQAPLVTPHKGDMLMGTITKLTSSEILIDINAKTEAVVLEKDRQILRKILSAFKVGDKVSVQVLNPESDFGNPVVSLRRTIEGLTWGKLSDLKKNQNVLEATVDSETKGGFLVTTKDGISGFLPHSHTSTLESPKNLIGKTIKVVVLEQNKELDKILFSQKQALSPSDYNNLTKSLKLDQKITAVITQVTPFGIFSSVSLPDGKFVEGFIHISEIAWQQDPLALEKFKTGDEVSAMLLGFDREGRRINLSVKRLTPDPIEKRLEEFAVDKKIKGKVVKVISSGVLLDFGEGISGIIKKEKVPVEMKFEEGSSVEVLVSEIDKKRHRVVVVPVLKEKPIGYR